jgi:tetraacyldisaccharide 4'-kinase
LLHLLYTQLARSRRRYYQRRPHLRRRLAAPVISVGNLTVGGSGKTPIAAEIARMLIEMGERPSILSRGYARQQPSAGVVVVSDGVEMRSDVANAGDEPLMLARAVPCSAVLVSPNRYLAGRLAETRLGCTVHILDDGFQHFQLMRDVDLLVTPDSVDNVQTLPSGPFREPLDAARMADALLVPVSNGTDASLMSERLGVKPSFGFSRSLGVPHVIADGRSQRTGPTYVGPILDGPPRRAFAFAGIARPERFYADLEQSGWELTGRRSFRDHHQYRPREIEELVHSARESGADVLLTTEKDEVRLPKKAPGTFLPIASVPLLTSIEPAFREWLRERLRALRSA